MKHIIYIGILLLFVSACNNRQRDNLREDAREIRNDLSEERVDRTRTLGDEIDSLGYYGVYESAAPLPEGATLKTKLVLYSNNRYSIDPVDLGNDVITEEEHGTYMILGDLLTLIPDNNGAEKYYKTSEEELKELDNDKKEVHAAHATNFRIIRQY